MTDGSGSMVSAEYKMRMCIFSALRKCIQNADFKAVTVSAICKEASISRSTFYNYFSDKYEVASWYTKLLARYGLDETGRSLSWSEGLLKTVEGMRAVDPFFRQVAHVKSMDFLANGSIDEREQKLTETVVKFKKRKLTPSMRMQIRAMAIAETMLVNEWMMTGSERSPRDFVADLETAMPHELCELLNEPSAEAANKPMLNLFSL